MKINLLIIATNKYTCFLKGLLDSANEYFLKGEEVTYNIFTDKIQESKNILSNTPYFDKIKFFEVEHNPFPYTTLYRYHFFKRFQKDLNNTDYLFYIDVDTLIKKPIFVSDIISDITAVQHCGFVGERGSYETNPKSTSYVGTNEGEIYYGGGFWGFSNEQFWRFISIATEMINVDKQNSIIPIWHDESVLNKYLIVNKPTKVLSPSYHYPEGCEHIKQKWIDKNLKYDCVILLLDKNHEEIRK